MKSYEKLGLTKENVINIQEWLFPVIEKTSSIGDMIIATALQFKGPELHYALYLLGSELGQASIKEQLNIPHKLNSQNV